MKTILFTFESDKERDAFIKYCKDSSRLLTQSENETSKFTLGNLIVKTLTNLQFDPPIRTKGERTAALYVTGTKMIEGPLSEIEKRFKQEITQHTGNVEIKELRGGEWKTIQSKRSQK